MTGRLLAGHHVDRFWSKVDTSGGPDACWPWTSTRQPKGYGTFKLGQWMRLAHRIAYEDVVGPIAEGLEVDHLCRNRACVNPQHLEPVTPSENVIRGDSPAGTHGRKTHCVNGHEFTPENTIERTDGSSRRRCRTCRDEANRRNHRDRYVPAAERRPGEPRYQRRHDQEATR